MKRIITFISVFALLLTACEGPQGPPGFDGFDGFDGVDGEDGVNILGQVIDIEGSFAPENDYAIFYEFPQTIEVFETDIVLVYLLWEQTEDSNGEAIDIWRLMPQTRILDEGLLQYNYDYTFLDVNIFLESNFNFPTNMKIRFMCDASGNRDDVYIDDIKITASTQLMQSSSFELVEELQAPQIFADEFEIDEEVGIYPNPAKDKLNIVSNVSESMEVWIFSTTGQLVYYEDELDTHELIDISRFEKGLYIVKVRTDDDVITKKLIKQ